MKICQESLEAPQLHGATSMPFTETFGKISEIQATLGVSLQKNRCEKRLGHGAVMLGFCMTGMMLYESV